MKNLHLAIITGSSIGITIIISIFVFFYVAPSSSVTAVSDALDLSNPTNNNPLGIKAEVIMEPDRLISCPTKCVVTPTPHLILTSNNDTQFVSYEVCNGNFCKKDLTQYVSAHMSNIPQNYTGAVALTPVHINLYDLSWKEGDTVHIIVKAFPVILQPYKDMTREPEKTMVVDLGYSTILGNSTKLS